MLTIPETPMTAAPVSIVTPMSAPLYPNQSAAPVLTLEELWRRLWRQKWLFLLTLLSTVLLAALITWLLVPTYRAIATIQIEKEGAQVVDFGNLNAPSPDLGEQDPFFRTQYEQLKSRQLAERVIAKLDLKTRLFDRKETPNAVRAYWLALKDWAKSVIKPLLARFLPDAPGRAAPTVSDHADIFLKGLYVEAVEKTHLVKVFYESPDPALSAEIVNTLIDTFIHDSINTESDTDTYAQAFLDRELEKARTRLKDSENAMVSYARDKGILEVNNSQATQERKLEELNSALGAAERRRIEAESQLGQAREHGNVAGVLTNPVVESLKRQLVDLEAEYQNKSKLFKPAYPDMLQLAQQIESVRGKLGREVGSLKQSLEAEFVAARRLEGGIRSELKKYKSDLVKLRDSGVEYNALKREVENNRQLYDDLLKRVSEVNVASGATTSNIRVIDSAVVPTEKFRPSKSLNLIVGFLTGLMLATGLALLRETLRRTVASGEELQTLSGLPVLGTIPHGKRMPEARLAMLAATDPGSPISEAYHIAAANLKFTSGTGAKPRILLMTSVHPAEGKSTSSVNMALSYAQMGAKVLLIDADLRRPTLHAKLGIENLAGLSDYAAGQADLSAITRPVAGVKNAFVITAGQCRTDPLSTLASKEMQALLALARQHFDVAVIDAPPVTGFADALVLTELADATVVVTDQDKIDRKRLMATLHQLQRVKQNVAGFLVVKARTEVIDTRYYDRYRDSSATVPKLANAGGGLNLGRPR